MAAPRCCYWQKRFLAAVTGISMQAVASRRVADSYFAVCSCQSFDIRQVIIRRGLLLSSLFRPKRIIKSSVSGGNINNNSHCAVCEFTSFPYASIMVHYFSSSRTFYCYASVVLLVCEPATSFMCVQKG